MVNSDQRMKCNCQTILTHNGSGAVGDQSCYFFICPDCGKQYVYYNGSLKEY